jgi:hypothetical protein
MATCEIRLATKVDLLVKKRYFRAFSYGLAKVRQLGGDRSVGLL